MSHDDRPLAGIRIVDLTNLIVGPACTERLVDFGASVVKIEPPEGDMMRTLGGPSNTGTMSGKYLHFNRGKRSVCLDLKQDAAREAVYRLVETSDVILTNMRHAALTKLGFDLASCRARNPSIIHCVISGFGPDGPYTGRPAYDTVLQGAAGISDLSYRRDGVRRFVPMVLADHLVAEVAVGPIIAALLKRERTGEPSAIEIPMLETMAAFILHEHMGATTFLPPLGPAGDTRILDPNNAPVETADGAITVTSNTNAQCAALLIAVGREDLLNDPRFRTVADRFRHSAEWFALRAESLRQKPSAHWFKVLGETGVPVTPCHTLDSLPDDEHLRAVGLVFEENHPLEGRVRALRPTVCWDGKPGTPAPPAEPLGQSTRDVLREIGYREAEIAALIQASGAAPSDNTATPRH